MSNITIFKNEELNVELRTILLDGVEWFIAKDIADYLEYSDTTSMTRRLDEDDIKSCPVDLPGQLRNLIIINESGLYTAILGSNKPMAKRFKKWVTSEVLPSIRKTGGYNMPTTYVDALKQLIISEEEKQRIKLERDEAIRLKAMVASGREGTLFSQTGRLTKQLNSALDIIDELEDENRKLKSNFSLTISGFTIKHKIKLSKTEKQQYGKELSKCCRDRNLEIHTHIFPGEKYPSNIYPEHILIEFFLRQGYDLNL